MCVACCSLLNTYSQCTTVQVNFPSGEDTLFICSTSPPINLMNFASTTTGTFSGQGVQADQMTFDPTSLAGGFYEIAYIDGVDFCNKIVGVIEFIIPIEDQYYCKDADPIGLLKYVEPKIGSFSGYPNSGAVSSLNNTFTPVSAGVGPYTITYSIGNVICEQQVSVGNIHFDLSADNIFRCTNEPPINLVHTINNQPNISPAFGNGAYFGGSPAIVNGQFFDPEFAGPGEHYVYYTDGIDTCKQLITVAGFVIFAELAPLPNTKFCAASAPVTLNGNGIADNAGYFSLDGVFLDTGPNGNNFEFIPSDYPDGAYEIIYGYIDSEGAGCQSKDTIILEVSSTVADVSITKNIFCESDESYPISFSPAGGTISVSDPGIIIADSKIDIDSSEVGNYIIYYEYIDANFGCSGLDSVQVEIQKGLDINFELTQSNCSNIADQINYIGEAIPDNVTLTWSIDDYELLPDSDSTSFSVDWDYPGNYNLIVKIDSAGCTSNGDLIAFEVEERYEDDCQNRYFIPNVFTPNDDDKNDQFNILGDGVTEMELRVFDRWGNEVFVTNDQTNSWDGTYDGSELANGVFFYSAEMVFEDGTSKIEKGTVTLLR